MSIKSKIWVKYEPNYQAFTEKRCNFMDKTGKKTKKNGLLYAKMQKQASNYENATKNRLYPRMYHQECPYLLALTENGYKRVENNFLVWYDLCG